MRIEVKKAGIHLQGVGMREAVPVERLVPGTVTMWNWGYTAEVEEVMPSKSGKTFQLRYADGTVDHRRFRRGRLIALA